MARENKVKNIIVLNSETLESTEDTTQAVADRLVVDAFFSDQLNIVAKYTTGASETATNCYIKAYGYVGIQPTTKPFPYADVNEDNQLLSDSDNWIQIGGWEDSSGTVTPVAFTFKVVGGTGATLYKKHFSLGVTFPKIYFTAYEDSVSANKGTITLHALIQ